MSKIQIQEIETRAKADQSFLKQICETKTVQGLISICSENDLPIEMEAAEDLFRGIESERDKQNDELSENDLEKVSGGFFVTWGTAFAVGVGIYGLYRLGKAIGEYVTKC